MTGISLQANSLAWDSVHQEMYLSLPSKDGATGNAIQVLNPTTGALGANVFAGSEPDLLSVSANARYLYVGLDGAAAVQRFTLPSLGTDVKIALGSGSFNDGPLYAADVQASPVSDGTVAVVRNVSGIDPAEEGGVVIYDGATARPNVLCGFIQGGCPNNGALYDSIQWNGTGTYMYAANNEDTGFDFYSIPVTASGFGKVTDYGGLAGGFGTGIHFDRVTGLVYEDNGPIIDPVAGSKVGQFNASGLMVPDGGLGTAFFISTSFTTSSTVTITSFDMERLTPISTVTLTNIVGSPSHLIRWGSNGLAFTTSPPVGSSSGSGAVYILSGSFVGAAPGVPPAISTNGIVPINSTSPTAQTGEWISIYGSNLSKTTATWNGDFPQSLGGTSVTVDGNAAYLSYVSPSQINLQVPNDSNLGPVSVVVTTGSGSVTGSLTLAAVGPSFPLLDGVHVAGIILRSDHSGAYGGGTYDILGPTGSSLGYQTVAARVGDSIALFAVGLGATNPVVQPGLAFSGSAPLVNPIILQIGGLNGVGQTNIQTSFAGLSGAGLYQINFTVPSGLETGDKAIEVIAGGVRTPAGSMISLQ